MTFNKGSIKFPIISFMVFAEIVDNMYTRSSVNSRFHSLKLYM